MHTAIVARIFWAVCLAGGFWLTSYGVLRQSFVDVATEAGFGEAPFGEGPFGGGLTRTERALVRVGVAVGLVSPSRELDVFDRRRNAAAAIAGVGLLALYTARDVIRLLRGG
jgi:hypothetical protein